MADWRVATLRLRVARLTYRPTALKWSVAVRAVAYHPDRYTSGDASALACREVQRVRARFRRGGMAEWSMAVVLKTTVPGRVPGVRIPLPPPTLAALGLSEGEGL